MTDAQLAPLFRSYAAQIGRTCSEAYDIAPRPAHDVPHVVASQTRPDGVILQCSAPTMAEAVRGLREMQALGDKWAARHAAAEGMA